MGSTRESMEDWLFALYINPNIAEVSSRQTRLCSGRWNHLFLYYYTLYLFRYILLLLYLVLKLLSYLSMYGCLFMYVWRYCLFSRWSSGLQRADLSHRTSNGWKCTDGKQIQKRFTLFWDSEVNVWEYCSLFLSFLITVQCLFILQKSLKSFENIKVSHQEY